MKNAELIARTLEQAGVRWVFGVPSGPVLPLIEALGHSDVQYVLTASETSAGFMATTIGAMTGIPGVCVATLGPGATNLATGVGAAWLDRAPVIALTCNVPTPWLDRRIQMRIDHHQLFRPITKATLPLRADNVAQQLGKALAIACDEPPGPVHLDLPEDVALALATEASSPSVDLSPGFPDVSDEAAAVLSKALAGSRRPLIMTGLTFTRSRARDRLLEFIERQGIPFISTMHAKGFLPESSPYWAGVLGRARRSTVQAFIDRADLIIAVGYDPIEINYEEWARGIPVVHISTEEADVDATVRLTNVVGALDPILDRLAHLSPVPNDWTIDELAAHRRELSSALRPATSSQLVTSQVLDLLRSKLPPDAILAYDVGAHTHQIATQWETDEPFTCFSTNGWSSMGFGMPAAYAAKLANPHRTVVGVIGDGCFQMTAGELAMARRLNLPVPIVVLDDGWLGLIKVKQERKGYQYSGVALGDVPEAPSHYFGVPVRAAKNVRELGEALDWALSLNAPSVIEAQVDVNLYSNTVYD